MPASHDGWQYVGSVRERSAGKAGGEQPGQHPKSRFEEKFKKNKHTFILTTTQKH